MRKKRIQVEPGKSVSSKDLSKEPAEHLIPESDLEESNSTSGDEMEINVEENDSWAGLRAFCPETDMESVYILVEFVMPNNNKSRFFMGKTIGQESSGKYNVKFMRQYRTTNTFVWPNVPDIAAITLEQIVGTADEYQILRRGLVKFNVDSKEWN